MVILMGLMGFTLWLTYKKLWKITIEIMDFPMNSMGGSFHSFLYVYQRIPMAQYTKSSV
jgi:hypothetical protein